MLALAQDSGARILQLSLPGNDCDAQQHRLQAATDALQHTPTLVAGIGPGAAFAWRWLATQSNDDAQALSVGFSLQQPDCAAPLPERAAHGRWNVAWNNNPDDASARFARERDILAALTTPNNARFYDAGVTDDRQPWLALRVIIRIESGPGAILSSRPERMKRVRS